MLRHPAAQSSNRTVDAQNSNKADAMVLGSITPTQPSSNNQNHAVCHPTFDQMSNICYCWAQPTHRLQSQRTWADHRSKYGVMAHEHIFQQLMQHSGLASIESGVTAMLQTHTRNALCRDHQQLVRTTDAAQRLSVSNMARCCSATLQERCTRHHAELGKS